MSWVPIGHRVLVKPMSVEEDLKKQYPSLEIPKTVSDREQYSWNRGVLVDWGPTAGFHFDDQTMEQLGFSRGDQVLYNQHVGVTFSDEHGERFIVINDQDLNLRWEEPEEGAEFVASEEANSG